MRTNKVISISTNLIRWLSNNTRTKGARLLWEKLKKIMRSLCKWVIIRIPLDASKKSIKHSQDF